MPSRETVMSLGLGQLISLFITGTGITSSLLAARGVALSSSQSFLNYFLLLGFLVVFCWRERWSGVRGVLRDRWWMYACLAVCDVEANFLVVLAYQYTSLSSVMLLDCFSIPCVMLLGRLVLGRRVTVWQLAGVVLCVAGVAALVLSDWLGSSFGAAGGAEHAVVGDLLCLASAVLYAVSNVGQEAAVVRSSKTEYLAMLALFAAPLSLAQSAGVEHARWLSTDWTAAVAGLMVGFGVCLFCVYALVPVMLERSGATFLNLSLLTSDVFAVIAGVFLFGYIPSLFYALGAVLIVGGLVVYNISCEPKAAEASTDAEAPLDPDSKVVTEA
jgi:solute carrier family 35 protein F1/2